MQARVAEVEAMDYLRLHKLLLNAALLCLAAGCAGTPNTSRYTTASPDASRKIAPTPAEIASAAEPAVVTIYAYADGAVAGSGTGFFVREDGVLITNLHVVASAETLNVELADGELFDDVYVLAADDQRDLILLQVPTSGTPSLEIGDDRDLRVGDKVYVLGNPLGLRRTFSDGIVSGKRLEDGVNYLQITAPISHGSSGGPVFNANGEVVGVATAYFEGGQNLNLAVPARHAAGLLAMAGAPQSFDELMAQILAEEAQTITRRSAETAELLAALPASTQASLASLAEYTRQATVRMLAYGAFAAENGYSMSDHSIIGTLSSDGADGESFLLQRGQYIAIGTCDDDCVDLDVVVLDSDGDAVAVDREPDADSVVSFEILKPATYTVGAHMVDCSAADCVYYVQLFHQE